MTPKGVAGKPYAQALERAGIVCNYNSIPFDPRKPFDPSGIRLGTSSITSRGMGASEMEAIAGFMDRAVTHIADDGELARIRSEVAQLTARFPAPGILL